MFVIKKIKNTSPWTYVIKTLMMKQMLVLFMNKNLKGLFRLFLDLKNVKCMLNGKVVIHLILVSISQIYYDYESIFFKT